MDIDQFIKEYRDKHNTKDAIYSSYHYDTMEAYANQRVIEELEEQLELAEYYNASVKLSERIYELKNIKR